MTRAVGPAAADTPLLRGKPLAGKVALVVGGGSGIGRAVATALAAAGANLVIGGIVSEELVATVDAIEKSNSRIRSFKMDVTDEAQVEELVAFTVKCYDGLHIAVNSAGIMGPPTPVAEVRKIDWDAIVSTNLTGTWLVMKHEIKCMLGASGGSIVNIASNIGMHTTRTGLAAYAASKAGVAALTRTAAREYISQGIRINMVSPGLTDTHLSQRPGETKDARAARAKSTIPLGREGTVQEIAAAVLWLVSDASSYAVGTDLVIDGGSVA